MKSNNLELIIVKIIADLGKGTYESEEVFSQEKITVILPGKMRMQGAKLLIGSEVYVVINSLHKEMKRGRFVPTFRDPMSDDNTTTPLQKQKMELDSKYKARFGEDKIRRGLA